ncbi:hypothetical protein [Bacteroides clarus]|uniref:Uncharacterized protein n=1 Tax=Bacteroides clarus TaxID=626929 RepID=A0A1Y3YU48_9BACE|nr:hypothetical protein [Bacteroides clarus]OUO01363.1 hypothetical protein B5F97_06790 [Bacteroides clarus]
MKNWQEIKAAINNALSNYNHTVHYVPPTKGRCSYFEIEITEEDFDMDDILNDLNNVMDQYQLSADIQGSDKTLDLSAHWDLKKR